MEGKTWINKDGKEVKRQRCIVYTRVMGYLRGYENFNIGKKSEFFSRKWFTEEAANNSPYVEKTPNQQFVEKYQESLTECCKA